MRAWVLLVALAGCGESGGQSPGDSGCPPTIDGGTLRASSATSCVYTCSNDAAVACGVVGSGPPTVDVCVFLRSDAMNCGQCGTRCIRTRDQGGTLDGICDQGRCR